MACCSPQCTDHRGKLLFKIGLLARDHVIIHSDSDHSGSSPTSLTVAQSVGLDVIPLKFAATPNSVLSYGREQPLRRTTTGNRRKRSGVGIGGSGSRDAGSWLRVPALSGFL